MIFALALWAASRLHPDLNAVVLDTAVPASVSWRVPTSSSISSSPAFADGVIYVAANDRTLSAIDFRTGRLRWQFTGDNSLMSAPIIDGNVVIVSSGDAQPSVWDPPHYIVLGQGPSTIYGIDRRTGAMRWHLAIAGTGMPSGAIVGGLYVHADGTGTVLALDPRNGAVRWRRSIESSGAMTAIVPLPDGTFLLSGAFPNAVFRLRGKDGGVLWEHRFPDCRAAFSDQPLAADATRVYGGYIRMLDKDPLCFGEAGTGEQHAYALDLGNGKLLWDHTLGRGPVPMRNEAAIPLVYEGRLYVGSSVEGVMHALDAATGRVLWQRRTKGPVKSGSVISGGTLYFGDFSGSLWALDAENGVVRGMRRERAPFNVGSPILVNETLVIGSQGGGILAVPLSSIRAGAQNGRSSEDRALP